MVLDKLYIYAHLQRLGGFQTFFLRLESQRQFNFIFVLFMKSTKVHHKFFKQDKFPCFNLGISLRNKFFLYTRVVWLHSIMVSGKSFPPNGNCKTLDKNYFFIPVFFLSEENQSKVLDARNKRGNTTETVDRNSLKIGPKNSKFEKIDGTVSKKTKSRPYA